MPKPQPDLDPVTLAGVDLVARTGAKTFALRWSDDEQPVVWMALAEFERDGRHWHEVAAGLTPRTAVYRLCEALMDGAQCTHCHRPTGVADDFEGEMPVDSHICWYRYDPELRTFRRGCEGTDQRPCRIVTSTPGRGPAIRCGKPEAAHVGNSAIRHTYLPGS